MIDLPKTGARSILANLIHSNCKSGADFLPSQWAWHVLPWPLLALCASVNRAPVNFSRFKVICTFLFKFMKDIDPNPMNRSFS